MNKFMLLYMYNKHLQKHIVFFLIIYDKTAQYLKKKKSTQKTLNA